MDCRITALPEAMARDRRISYHGHKRLARNYPTCRMFPGAGYTMQALILAGGEGRRMREVTSQVPKPLLYLPGGTLLEHQSAMLSQLPITHTFVVTRHRRQEMSRVLRGLNSVTEIGQRAPFTLLGALASAKGYVTEPSIVLHGDNYFSHGLDYLVKAAQSALHEGGSKGVFLVEAQDGRRSEDERLASVGCYVLGTGVLALAEALRGADELRFLTRALLESGARVDETPLMGWRSNINELVDLLGVIRRQLERRSPSFHTAVADEGYNRTDGWSQWVLPVWVSPEAEVVDSHVGPFAVIGPRAVVRNCVLSDAVVFPNAEVQDRRVEGGVVLPSGAVVLSSHHDVHCGQEGPGEQEQPKFTPSRDEQQHSREQEPGKGDDLC
jgi:dTDP-glucose pyrophosphorylase